MAPKKIWNIKIIHLFRIHTHISFPCFILQPLLQEPSFSFEEFPEATEIIHGLWVGTAEAGIEATVGVNSRQSLGKPIKKIFPLGW